MMKYSLVKSLVFLLALFVVSNTALENEVFLDQYGPVELTNPCEPSFCPNSTMVSTNVINFCKSIKRTIQSRCCLDRTNATETKIIGLDFSACKIDKLYNAIESIKRNNSIKFVEILDLNSNQLSECQNQSYSGFVSLQRLFIPDTCSCPGANYSWSNIAKGSCSSRTTVCNTSFSPNVNCTVNSLCVDNGPGNFLCECKSDFHGYKCLSQGQFPTILFTSVLCGSTVLLSAFLWHTQRRHVAKKSA